MADTRIQMPVKVVDPTTNSQEMGVTSSGEAKVLETNSSAALTALQLIDNVVRSEDEASADGHSGVVVLARRTASPANQSGTDGDYEFLQVSAGRLWASATIDAAIPAGTNNIGDVDVLSVVPGTSATSLGKAEDAAHSSGDTGVMMLAVRNDSGATTFGADGDYSPVAVDANGHLQVDVLSGGGVDTPSNPAVSVLSSSSLAAGSSADTDTSDLASKKCWQVDLGSSVAFKAVIKTLTNGAATTISTVYGQPGTTVQWRPPHRNWVASGSSAGADGFRISWTNLDTSEAADMAASIYYSD